MSECERNRGPQHNAIFGAGQIITGGVLFNNRIEAKNFNGPQNPLIRQLQDELTRARQCLADDPASTVDHEDAVEALDALQGEIAQDPDPDQRGLKVLRLRVKALIGVLLPVAEIIGGVAAFEEICRHL
jgi:hypothetical protein